MKRSEMIEKIVIELDALGYNCFEKISYEEVADSILKLQEELGIYPPYSGSDPWGVDRAMACELTWEPEDD